MASGSVLPPEPFYNEADNRGDSKSKSHGAIGFEQIYSLGND